MRKFKKLTGENSNMCPECNYTCNLTFGNGCEHLYKITYNKNKDKIVWYYTDEYYNLLKSYTYKLK